MLRRKQDFIVNTNQKCVHVHCNGEFENGKVLYMEPDWTLHDFYNAASQRLEMVPTAFRVFSADGVEIDDCMMIEDDDILFLSNGPDFMTPFLEGPVERMRGQADGEIIPSTIGGYKVGKFLGRGGFGEVRVGEHQLTGERVALKFLRKADIMSIGAAERTTTEIQCLTALKHQNVIRLQQHMESAQHVVLVFELMEGGDLYNYMKRQGTTAQQIALGEDEARHIFHQILSGVAYAHNQHICHRDLKLENILLKGKTLSHVKIADFGLSDFYRPGAMMKSTCGTLSFLSPEVFRGSSNAGPPLDVWSLGVILFALLCGRLPFEGPDLLGAKRPRDPVIRARILKCQYKIDDALSPEAKDLVRRMLKLDPAERASIPEIFNHCWLRSASTSIVDFLYRDLLIFPEPVVNKVIAVHTGSTHSSSPQSKSNNNNTSQQLQLPPVAVEKQSQQQMPLLPPAQTQSEEKDRDRERGKSSRDRERSRPISSKGGSGGGGGSTKMPLIEAGSKSNSDVDDESHGGLFCPNDSSYSPIFFNRSPAQSDRLSSDNVQPMSSASSGGSRGSNTELDLLPSQLLLSQATSFTGNPINNTHHLITNSGDLSAFQSPSPISPQMDRIEESESSTTATPLTTYSPTFRLVPLRRAVNSAAASESSREKERAEKERESRNAIIKMRSCEQGSLRPSTASSQERRHERAEKEHLGMDGSTGNGTLSEAALKLATLSLGGPGTARGEEGASVATSRERDKEREARDRLRHCNTSGVLSTHSNGIGLMISAAPKTEGSSMSSSPTTARLSNRDSSSNNNNNNEKKKAIKQSSALHMAGTSSLRSHRATSVPPPVIATGGSNKDSKMVSDDDVTENLMKPSRSRGMSSTVGSISTTKLKTIKSRPPLEAFPLYDKREGGPEDKADNRGSKQQGGGGDRYIDYDYDDK